LVEGVAARPDRLAMARTDGTHLAGVRVARLGLAGRAQRVVYEVAPDGNAAVLEEQTAKAAETALAYQLTSNLYRKYLGMVRGGLGTQGSRSEGGALWISPGPSRSPPRACGSRARACAWSRRTGPTPSPPRSAGTARRTAGRPSPSPTGSTASWASSGCAWRGSGSTARRFRCATRPATRRPTPTA